MSQSSAQAIQTALQFHRNGRLPQAEMMYRGILEREPNNHDALHLLGVLLHQRGQNAEALELIQKAIALSPHFPESHSNLGIVQQALGQLDDAIASFKRAVELNPNHASSHYNLGVAYKDKSCLPEAFDAFKRALEVNPNDFNSHNNLAILYRFSGRPEEALAECYATLRLNPRLPEGYMNLGSALLDFARFDEGIAAFRKAIAIKPDYANAHDALVFNLYFDANQSPQAIIDAHKAWAKNCAAPFIPKTPTQAEDRNPDRPLRIGFVSPDFRLHAVSFFLLPLLESFDRSKFHITCYYNQTPEDDITQRIQAAVDQFRNITKLTDDQAAAQVRADNIDILIDLAGHSADARLLLFARKPAPIQMTWLGYPGTTGLFTIDYRITDNIADPDQASEPAAPEKLLRLPHTAWCFSSLGLEPPIGPPPASQNGYVTLGTFNRLAKVSATTLELWAQILQQAPNTKLLLKNSATQSNPIRKHILHFFLQKGIAEDRLLLNPWRGSIYDHREAYNDIDIALDTFPYHGTTTTCEALFMGVPVVTLAGNAHVSRVGASLLTTAGLPDLVAHTPEQYVQTAVTLANDLPRLTHLRQTLRPQVQASPLMNSPQFAHDFESALRQSWQTYCRQ